MLQYDVLGVDVVQRLRFATTAMHAYGHEWACQLVYNPRLTEGLGLSDGEGTERLWSRLIRLIGIERSSSVRNVCHVIAVLLTLFGRGSVVYGCLTDMLPLLVMKCAQILESGSSAGSLTVSRAREALLDG